jgi:ribose transport system substrate-binding protein
MKKLIVLALIAILSIGLFVGCGDEEPASTGTETETASAEPEEQRVYYYVAPFMGHPYIYDVHLGMKYAAQQFGVEIVKSGPDGWDPKAAAESFEQAIAKKPDGIVTIMWDGSLAPAVKTAREAGIPVMVMEAAIDDHGALVFLGLDNYQNGVDTAKELIKIAGDSGKAIVQGNWGASNTDAKLAGVKDYLEANSNWEVVAEVDDKGTAEDAIEGAKAALNAHKDATAFVGINSEGGVALRRAMDELGMEPGSIKAVVHDRQVGTLEAIEEGYVNASLMNKSASGAYFAIAMMELYNVYGAGDIPVSSNNKEAGINPFPENMYAGLAVINQDNVDFFKQENIPTFDTPLYK